MSELSRAEYIIIGGGAIGLGVAYALARAGKTDILLLERAPQLASATTSQGAGLCGQVRDSAERVRLAMNSVATFRELQATDVKPDWNEVGSLRIALSARRAAEFHELHRVSTEAGLETALLDPTAAKRLWPPMDFKDASAILWCPSDGYMTPTSVAESYAHACRKLGVRIATSTEVTTINRVNGRVHEVVTNRGTAECQYLINAAGAHAYHIAALAGLELPIVPVRHEYFVTVAMPDLTPGLPCFRIPELTLYGRVRERGLLLGGWEPKSVQLDPREYPLTDSPPPVVEDWTVLGHFADEFARLFPEATTVSKAWVGKGWPTFTPDGRFIIGESRRVPGFVMAGGCNAHGISGSGGIGKLLVEALTDPRPSAYVRSLSPDRFTETRWTWAEARENAARIYETYYGV